MQKKTWRLAPIVYMGVLVCGVMWSVPVTYAQESKLCLFQFRQKK